MKLVLYFLVLSGTIFFAASLDSLFPTPDFFFDTFNFTLEDQLVFDDAFRGTNPESDITLAYFIDFNCPACLSQHADMKRIMQENPDVNFLYKHLSHLEPTSSRQKAIAFECAQRQGNGELLSDYLFQNEIIESDLFRRVEDAGLDKSLYATCYTSNETKEIIIADLAHAAFLKVSGTPTMYINGVRVDGVHSYEVYTALIDRARSRVEASS